ncbi:MAG: FdhD/NarQ family, partial [Pseudonocardiales bacterium]|nr:FdhD/NarQ family [Pseudonocardiales bacterium]
LAMDAGLTLIGFLRGQTMNVYAGQHRIERASAHHHPLSEPA